MRNNELRQIICPIGPSIAYVPLTKGFHALIDSDDAEWVGRHNWCATIKSGNPYALRGVKHCPSVYLHRAVLKPEPGFHADHMSGNTLDNRRANLRQATAYQNQWNCRGRAAKSGLKGAWLEKSTGIYVAGINKNYKRIILGRFATAEEAHEAYMKAAKEMHGEFARAG